MSFSTVVWQRFGFYANTRSMLLMSNSGPVPSALMRTTGLSSAIQTNRPFGIEVPRAPGDLDCLFVMAQLVIGRGQGGKPHEQTRVGGTEANPFFDERNRFIRIPGIGVHAAPRPRKQKSLPTQ